jgi:hypothetical protein
VKREFYIISKKYEVSIYYFLCVDGEDKNVIFTDGVRELAEVARSGVPDVACQLFV